MSNTIKLTALALAAAFAFAGFCNSADAYTWTGPTSGTANWSDVANWGGGGYPNAQDAIADLTMDVTGELTITLDVPVTIGSLIDGDTDAGGATPSQIILAGNPLTFDVSSGNASWAHSPTNGAPFDIQSNVLLDDSIDVSNSFRSWTGWAIISGDISASSAGTKTLNWNGTELTGQTYLRTLGAINDGAGQLAVNCQGVGGGSGFYFNGTGSDFTGEVHITAPGADIMFSTPDCAGDTSAGTTIGNNSSILLRSSDVAEPLTISGGGARGGALLNDRLYGGDTEHVYRGPITLADDSRIGANAGVPLVLDVASGNAVEGEYTLTFNTWGPITVNDPIVLGSGGLVKQGGDTLVLNTTPSYTGDTFIDQGEMEMTAMYLDDSSTVHIASGAEMALTFVGIDQIAGLVVDGVPQADGVYDLNNLSEYLSGTGALQVVTPSAELTWTGGGADNLWSNSDNWDGTVAASTPMIVDLQDAVAEVKSDFISGGTGPAGSLSVGETVASTISVDPAVTLEVAGNVTIDSEGQYVAKVQGSDSGKINSTAGSLALDSVESLRVDWVENGASSMFGGTYTVAEYVGGDLSGLSGEFSNAGSNVGGAYVEAVDYTTGGQVNVTLYQQKVGDVDLDGDVEFSDLSNLLDNWGIGTSWDEGDTDFSGDVVFADLSNLLDNWGTPLASGAGAQIGVVPEPGTLMMLIVGMAGLLIQRKRR